MTRRRAKPAPARPALVRPPFPAAGVALLGTIGDRAIAKQVGVTTEAVAAERKRRRIAPARSGPRSIGKARRSERIQVFVTSAVAERIDVARGKLSRSDWGAAAIERALGQTAPPFPSEAP